MNSQIQKLHDIAGKKTRLIIGLMSGTSLDGLDVALCKISGFDAETEVEVLAFETHSYDSKIKEKIRRVFTKKIIDLQQLTLLNAWIGDLHASMILKSLEKWNFLPEKIDAVASHGQTVFHAPKSLHGQWDFPNATLQIGDGDHIAVKTGIITLSDFRQKHIAASGEGAPLAVYGDALIFSSPKEDRILLNMGGIANFTFLPKGDLTQATVTDTGPGNTLIDLVTKKYFNQPFDKNGEIAASGKIIPELLAVMKSHPFFEINAPKTTGQELFNLSFLEKSIVLSENSILTWFNNSFEGIALDEKFPLENLIATLTRFSAETIADEILELGKPAVIYSSGGGMHNPVLMSHLQELLPDFIFKTTDDLGISGDAKEAVLFAILANQTLAGSPIKIADLPQVNFGKVSFSK